MTNGEDNQREERIENARKTLESRLIQNAVGSSNVRTNVSLYGELANHGAMVTYDEVMQDEETVKTRNNIYQKRLNEYRKNGVYGEPSQLSNGDMEFHYKTHAEENKPVMPLGDLAAIVKKMAPEFNIEVPGELGNYIPIEIIEKAVNPQTGQLDESKLNDKEKDAFTMFQVLSQAYDRAAAINAGKKNYFADFESIGKKINEKYKPKEKK